MGAPYLTKWETLDPTHDEEAYLFDNIASIMETPGNIFSLPKGTINRENIIEVRSGLRPVRDLGPRIEKEDLGDKTIIHNYGHGGSGVILSWGTAQEAVNLLET